MLMHHACEVPVTQQVSVQLKHRVCHMPVPQKNFVRL